MQTDDIRTNAVVEREKAYRAALLAVLAEGSELMPQYRAVIERMRYLRQVSTALARMLNESIPFEMDNDAIRDVMKSHESLSRQNPRK